MAAMTDFSDMECAGPSFTLPDGPVTVILVSFTSGFSLNTSSTLAGAAASVAPSAGVVFSTFVCAPATSESASVTRATETNRSAIFVFISPPAPDSALKYQNRARIANCSDRGSPIAVIWPKVDDGVAGYAPAPKLPLTVTTFSRLRSEEHTSE